MNKFIELTLLKIKTELYRDVKRGVCGVGDRKTE